MKTQIIALASHDDLISIRDRMSWAKAPRILLVWPPRGQMSLQPLDLRILQQHARQLGAAMGVVTRKDAVQRDARAFGIPVFRSTVDAQRLPWSSRSRRARRQTGSVHKRISRLRQLREWARPAQMAPTSTSVARIAAFGLGVVSVCVMASLFVPRATVTLEPQTQEQNLTMTVDLAASEGTAPVRSGLPVRVASVQVSGQQSTPVSAKAEVATAKAGGVAQLQNLSAATLLVPSGTVVYSLAPELRRYLTLQDAHLDAANNSTAAVPIEAVEGGAGSNLPAGSLAGVEGRLSASVGVANADPISGGASTEQSVPSQLDRDQVRAALEQTLMQQAKSQIEATLQADDLLLPGTMAVLSVERETFDPPAGGVGSVLSLTLEATYRVEYVRGADMRAMAALALDSQTTQGFVPQAESLRMQVNQITTADDGTPVQLQLDLRRRVHESIDPARANQLVRGRTAIHARALLRNAFPLSADPEIRLSPAWWPWLPLIPFRIEVSIT